MGLPKHLQPPNIPPPPLKSLHQLTPISATQSSPASCSPALPASLAWAPPRMQPEWRRSCKSWLYALGQVPPALYSRDQCLIRTVRVESVR